MRLVFAPVFAVLAISCGDINVSPPDLDHGATDVADIVEVQTCMTDADCVGMAQGDCQTVSCSEAHVCLVEYVTMGTSCGSDLPRDSVCKSMECDGSGQCVVVQEEDGAPCTPTVEPGPCEKYQCLQGDCVLADGCEDGNPCTEDVCLEDTGECTNKPLSTGKCDDDNVCTEDDQCFAGTCQGELIECDDDNPCTKDLCSPEAGCVYPPDDEAGCDDGNKCTIGDKCVGGECKGAIKMCTDGNPCTDDWCDGESGNCVFKPNSEPCDDGDPCTVDDYCGDGQCNPGGYADCNDDEPCTEDYCVPFEGCINEMLPGCKDCTENKECEDGNQCTEDVCVKDDGQGEGKCANEPLSGVPCVDQDPCKIEDTCIGGKCISGTKDNCVDGNVCTDDICNLMDGSCEFVPNDNMCDDGNECTHYDQCDNGECSGAQTTCDDGNLCTDDYCDEGTGACEFVPNNEPCNDGDKCTVDDKCSDKSCSGIDLDCDDGDPCTIDDCVSSVGCVHGMIPGCENCESSSDCNDQNPCTKDSCTDGKCAFTNQDGKTCDDGDECTILDMCQEGECDGTASKNCDDYNDCTADSCDSDVGCINAPVSGNCNDGDPCTWPDQCVEGECVSGPLICCADYPDGTPCSDQDNATDPDYCIGGECLGFMNSTFSESGQATWFTDVDAGSGMAFATGYYAGADGNQTGFVASVPYQGSPSVVQSTVEAGRAYRSVSHLVAVGDAGLAAFSVSWQGGTTWTKGGILEQALRDDQGIPPDALSGVFGTLATVTSGDVTLMPPYLCNFMDQYLIVGRYGGEDPGALARHCIINQYDVELGCKVMATCGHTVLVNTDPALVFPGAAAGLGVSCGTGQACLQEAEFAAHQVSLAGAPHTSVFMGISSADTMFEEFEMVGHAPDEYHDPTDMTRLAEDGASEGGYVTVGNQGLLMYGPGGGPFQVIEFANDQGSYNFSGVTVNNAYMFVSGEHWGDASTKSIVVVVHPLAEPVMDKDSYKTLVLDTCSGGCGGFELTGITATNKELYVVGNLSDADGNATGVVYFLEL